MSRRVSSYSKLKNDSIKTRCSVEDVKNILRKQFRERLKNIRNENLYSIRNLVEDIHNLKLFKCSVQIETSELTATEIIEILEEVERELQMEFSNDEGDEYERFNNIFMEEMLRNNICPICNNLLNNIQSTICEQCSESFNV